MRVGAKRWLGLAALVVTLSSASCGGKSRTQGGDPEPSQGGSSSDAGVPANGGASNAVGAGGPGAAGRPNSVCPGEQPNQGDHCNYDNSQYCIYPIDKCSSVGFECFKSIWLQVPQLDGASYDCNSFNAPKDGDSCECLGQLDCLYNDCAGRGQIHAVCDNTSWQVEEVPCARQP